MLWIGNGPITLQGRAMYPPPKKRRGCLAPPPPPCRCVQASNRASPPPPRKSKAVYGRPRLLTKGVCMPGQSEVVCGPLACSRRLQCPGCVVLPMVSSGCRGSCICCRCVTELALRRTLHTRLKGKSLNHASAACPVGCSNASMRSGRLCGY